MFLCNILLVIAYLARGHRAWWRLT